MRTFMTIVGLKSKALTVLVVGVMCAMTMVTGAATGTGPAAAAPVEATGIDWTSCGSQLECANVSVPLNWTQPGGTHIKLAVIRHLASDPQQRIGTMFVNPGGPGESGVDVVRDGGADFDAWGDGRFDVVGWDPRGTNASDPVRCFTSKASEDRFWRGVQIPTTPAASRAYARKTTQLAKDCARVSGPLLNNISTEDTARDLDYLRQLVGDKTITYVGLSYGSFIGEIYANMFPTHVRAMMLDGILDPKSYVQSAEARTANQSSAVDKTFEQFLALCQGVGPAGCALAGHPETVATRVAKLFQEARRAPIPAPHASPSGVLSYGDLLLTTFTPPRDPNLWPQYAKELDAAAGGDASALETGARLLRTPAAYTKSTTSAAIQCLDGAASEPVSAWPKVVGHISDISPLWGAIQSWWLWAPCASNWPGHATERYTGPWNAKTATPILLVNNVYDPATSYANAQQVERLLGNAVLLTVANYGHPSYQIPSQCTENLRVRYLVDLVTPPPGTVCAADRAPFKPAVSQPSAPEIGGVNTDPGS
jgi:pimeloyl-ACP methyl ester carboxylesterase